MLNVRQFLLCDSNSGYGTRQQEFRMLPPILNITFYCRNVTRLKSTSPHRRRTHFGYGEANVFSFASPCSLEPAKKSTNLKNGASNLDFGPFSHTYKICPNRVPPQLAANSVRKRWDIVAKLTIAFFSHPVHSYETPQ